MTVRRRRLEPEEMLLVRKILSGVARGGQRWGKRKIVAMLIGRSQGLPESLTGLSTTGLLKDEKPATLEKWIDAAVGGGLLAPTDDVYRTLALTRVGRDVMAGRRAEVELTLPEASRGRPARSAAMSNG